MIKLVVSDMDGTLLNKKCGISNKNLKAIHQLYENNIEFAIASGRDYSGVYSIMQEYHLHAEAILGNGAQYVNRAGDIILSCYMNKQIIKDVITIFKDLHIPYFIFTTNGFYSDLDPNFVRDSFIQRSIKLFGNKKEDYEVDGKLYHVPCNHIQRIEDIETFLKQDIDIIKVEGFSLDYHDIIPAKERLKDIPTISYLSSFKDNVEVTDEYAQKGYILEKVVSLKGIKKDEVAVLGDGMNDISLFQCFPYGYAPSNAESKIKKHAYQVVSSCEEDGFYEAVQMILKQNKNEICNR